MQDGRFDTNSRFLLEYLLTFIYYSILRNLLVLDTLIDIPVIGNLFQCWNILVFRNLYGVFAIHQVWKMIMISVRAQVLSYVIRHNFCNDFIVLKATLETSFYYFLHADERITASHTPKNFRGPLPPKPPVLFGLRPLVFGGRTRLDSRIAALIAIADFFWNLLSDR